jgi:diguanylate cyclase (GGDEF)-like protein/PAS domain S-box-containing protein
MLGTLARLPLLVAGFYLAVGTVALVFAAGQDILSLSLGGFAAIGGWLVSSAGLLFVVLDRMSRQAEAVAAGRAREMLRTAEACLDTIMDSLVDGLVVADQGGTIRQVNPTFTRLFGYSSEEAVGEPIEGLLAEPHAGALRQRWRSHVEDGREALLNSRMEVVARRRDGTPFPAELSLAEMDQNGERRFVVMIHDITARRKAASRLDVAEKVLECTKEGVMVTDRRGTMLWVNQAFCRISGYERDEVLGRNAGLLKSGLQGADFYAAMWSAIREHGTWEGEMWNRRKDGEAYPEWLSIRAIADESGQITRYVGVFSDISRHKQAEETIRTLTYYDPVTRLPNRHLFNDRLTQSLERALRSDSKAALVMIGLDRFKQINETLGHQTGDLLLRAVAERLEAALRGEDTVARLRGDTFCCLLGDLTHDHDVHPVLSRLIDSFGTLFQVAGQEVFISGAVGIAMFPVDGNDPDDLVRKAETAMNRSKEMADHTYQFYTPAMHAHSVERLSIEAELRKAIDCNQLCVHYQAKVTPDGTITGAEALLRWTHPTLGAVSPAHFIPIAEENGLIGVIGAWVLQQVCRQMALWAGDGLPTIKVAVNLSTHQLRQADLPDRILSILGETGIAPHCLELEVTESAVMRNAEAAIHTLETLHGHGISVAIDDFGTGYSSLAYLKKFPVNTLKIDRSFIHDLETNPASAEIVAAIIAMSHSLKLSVVAEGVENAGQLARLQGLKCDHIQGFHFTRPVPAEAFAVLLRGGSLRP